MRCSLGTINVFFQRWLSRLPLPLGAADQKAGYWWELSMAQVEVSRTIVFTQPRHARSFFDALITKNSNLDLGRPDTIEIIFDRQVRSNTGSEFKTKVVTRGTEVTINAFYKHSRIKQYLKDQRALRIETVVNAPGDLGCQRPLILDELQARARAVNARLLETERAGQGCVLANPVFERIAHPSVDADGRRATAMRFGDSRVQALPAPSPSPWCAVTGITNRSLRALMTGLPGAPYGMTQASYDLARLRRNGLITRQPTPTPTTSPPTAWPSPASSTPRSTTGSSHPVRPRPATGATPTPRRPPGNRTPYRRTSRRRPATYGSLTNSAQLSKSPTQRVARACPVDLGGCFRLRWRPWMRTG